MLTINYEKVGHAEWPSPIFFKEITQVENHDGTLLVRYQRDGKQKQTIKSGGFKKQAGDVLANFEKYYGRYGAAVQFQKAIELERTASLEGQQNSKQ